MITPKRLTAKQVAVQLEMSLNQVYLERASGRLIGEPHGSRSWRFTQPAVDQYRTSRAPAKALPTDLTALIDQRIAAALESAVRQLRGDA